ncbi:MAG TPA: hypothetical protein VFY28_03170, partial [Candidatus Paceibacterota bacterium]|nr:hypothetical protein [Candidatus Paceibacterota bacterium]
MSDTTHDPSSGAGDRSKYIRTYAKDVAALTGSEPVAGSEPRKTPPPTPAPPPPKKPSPWEMPKASQDTAKLYAAKEPEEERSVVLERLRNKLKQSAAIEVEDVAPAPERAPAPAPPPPPVFAEPPPPPPPVPPVPPKEAKPSPLHTYTSDFADRIDERKASTFSVLAAETDTKAPAKKASRRTVASTALAVLLFALGGIGIAGAAWYVVRLSATPLAPLSVPSLVFADERVKLSGTGRELMQQLAETAREPLVDGNVLVTYLSESTTTPKGEPREIPLAGGALIRALQLPAPDILLRNVSPASTVGIVSAGLETRPFFVFRVTSYERTFAGMLA